jgi:phage-related minor tail protein
VVGTTVKALFKVAPYLFPQTQMIWGGITAAVEMARVLPKFAKLAEGLIIGGDADDETAFTKAMHKWDNYMSKFSDSYSDKGQSSNWSYEKIADTVTDVFAQLYQMRAAASLSKLAVKDPTAQAIKKF